MRPTDNKRHVLVVEDEVAILRGVLRSINRDPSLRGTGCHSVDDGVKVLISDPPDLLVTDLNLPGRHGLEMISELESAGLAVPIIIMTAHRAAFEPYFPRNQELTVLEKPVSTAVLLERIHLKLQEVQAGPIGPSFQVSDYLQMAAMGGYSVVLRISLSESNESNEGWLEIVEGNIWNAVYGGLTGEEAVAALLTEPATAVATQAMTDWPKTRQIEKTTNNLMLDLARQIDEQRRAQRDQDQQTTVPPSSAQQYSEMFECGMAAVGNEDWEAAATAFRQALEIQPGDARARYNLERIEQLRSSGSSSE